MTNFYEAYSTFMFVLTFSYQEPQLILKYVFQK